MAKSSGQERRGSRRWGKLSMKVLKTDQVGPNLRQEGTKMGSKKGQKGAGETQIGPYQEAE